MSAPDRPALDAVVGEIEALLVERRRRSMAWWRECDLSVPQLHLLATLNERGPTTVGALADALCVSAPSASTIVDRLVERGAVERIRCTADRRQVMVSLSEQGRRFAEDMHGVGHSALQGVLGQLDDAELAQMLTLIRRVADVARQTPDDTPPLGTHLRI